MSNDDIFRREIVIHIGGSKHADTIIQNIAHLIEEINVFIPMDEDVTVIMDFPQSKAVSRKSRLGWILQEGESGETLIDCREEQDEE